ncbi:MAG: TPR end-of-group domain-containing protein [Planctomycetota bacterium]
MTPSFRVHCLAILIALATPPLLAQDDVTAQLDRIVSFLDGANPNRRAAAVRQLGEKIGAPQLADLARYMLLRPVGADALLALSHRLDELIELRFDDIESLITRFEGVRLEARELAVRAAPPAGRAPDDTPEAIAADEADELGRQLTDKRAEREEARARLAAGALELERLGIAISMPLWARIERGDHGSRGVVRFRERLRAAIESAALAAFPTAPAHGAISPFERRCLVPLFANLLPSDPEGWAQLRDEVANEALAQLASGAPDRVRAGRITFLRLGDWGRTRLRTWANEADTPQVTGLVAGEKRLRERFARLNEYAVPPSISENSAIEMGDYATLDHAGKLQLLHRLEWTIGETAAPVLARVLELETELALRVEAAAALARLGDARGPGFLRLLALEEAAPIERISRQVLIAEAIRRRESGDAEGALQDLQSLLLRFVGDFRLHYEIGYAALLARRLDLAVQHFLRALKYKTGDATTSYNLACSYALLGQPDAALAALKAAIQNGYKDRDHMSRDPDFIDLRDDPRFRALLESIGLKP